MLYFIYLWKEGENLLRISSKVVVAILEAPSCVLNPDHFLLFGSEHVEGLLCVFGILGPCIIPHLNRQVRHRDRRRKELRRHIGSRESARTKSIPNSLHVLEQHLLAPAVIEFCGPAIGVTCDPLRSFQGAVVLQKICDAGRPE